MQSTLKLKNAVIPGFLVAAKIHNIKVKDRAKLGADESLITIDFKSANDLFFAGLETPTYKGTELETAANKAETKKA